MPQGRAAFSFCTGFAVRNLASPFGWEVGPLGLGGGSSLAGLYGLARLVRFICVVVVGALVVGQSKFESEFPPSVACRRHLPPRGTAFGWCFGWLLLYDCNRGSSLCPFGTSLLQGILR